MNAAGWGGVGCGKRERLKVCEVKSCWEAAVAFLAFFLEIYHDRSNVGFWVNVRAGSSEIEWKRFRKKTRCTVKQ